MELRCPNLAKSQRALHLMLFVLLATGACIGIVYWAWQGSLVGVALSALVPGSYPVLMVTPEARSPEQGEK